MEIKKILVIYKTHLDIGYTDLAANVLQRYFEQVLPAAIQTAKTLNESEQEAGFVWSTGSWLIAEYLRTQPEEKAEELREAIKRGYIRWHGLPFTMHTDIMSSELLEYGLSLSQRLDQEFGRKTIAAKMTDVPGHSKAIIPWLKKAGIEFLHIGVNPASMIPDVPVLFRWRCDSGETINVMYQEDYGDFTRIGNSDIALCFAHTGDNHGCQSQEEVMALYASLKEKYPGAEIVAADLNDLADVVREIEDELPIIKDEIGDTWIHGASSDPKILAQYKGLERLFMELPEGKDKETLARGIIMVPEHTWGLDTKQHLKDFEYFKRTVFEEKRRTMPAFKIMEESWQEKRDCLVNAVQNLSDETRQKAQNIMEDVTRKPAVTEGGRKIDVGEAVKLGSYTMRFNRQGEIDYLENYGNVLADEKHRLLTLIYEQFGDEDYKRFYSRYIRREYVPGGSGALKDFTKVGMYHGTDCYSRYEPLEAQVTAFEDRIVVTYLFPNQAITEYGCPGKFDLIIAAGEHKLYFDLAWFDKAANRMAEAIWVGFCPRATGKTVRKFKQCIDPKKVVKNGQCRLHGTDYGVVYKELAIETIDAAVVAMQEPSLLHFCNVKPEDEDGVHFNLFNNVWGTNFPMWFDEDARFRFVLSDF